MKFLFVLVLFQASCGNQCLDSNAKKDENAMCGPESKPSPTPEYKPAEEDKSPDLSIPAAPTGTKKPDKNVVLESEVTVETKDTLEYKETRETWESKETLEAKSTRETKQTTKGPVPAPTSSASPKTTVVPLNDFNVDPAYNSQLRVTIQTPQNVSTYKNIVIKRKGVSGQAGCASSAAEIAIVDWSLISPYINYPVLTTVTAGCDYLFTAVIYYNNFTYHTQTRTVTAQ